MNSIETRQMAEGYKEHQGINKHSTFVKGIHDSVIFALQFCVCYLLQTIG